MVQLEENGSETPPAITWSFVANVPFKKPTAAYQEDIIRNDWDLLGGQKIVASLSVGGRGGSYIGVVKVCIYLRLSSDRQEDPNRFE
jgi:hypothetical protein